MKRQIGNAVPPCFAKTLLKRVVESLKEADKGREGMRIGSDLKHYEPTKKEIIEVHDDDDDVYGVGPSDSDLIGVIEVDDD